MTASDRVRGSGAGRATMMRVLAGCAMAWLSALVVAPVAPAQEARFEGRTLTEWTAALADPQTRVRRHAVVALMTFGPAALPGLTQALADADPEVRLAGAKGLGRLGSAAQPAVPSLVEAMKDRVGIVRRVAALSLGSIRPSTPEGIAALVRALGDVDAAVLDNAAHSLIDLGPAAVPALTEALKHPDGGVRAGAAVTLTAGVQFGKFRPVPAETVRALIEALKDSQPDVRDEVARVLAEVGPTGRVALGPLREVAQRDPVESVRRTAERAIERLESQNP